MRALATSWEAFLEGELEQRSDRDLLRSLRAFTREGPWVVTDDGRRLLDLSSNDYLGIAADPALRESAARGATRGAGARASRLTVGTDPATLELEARLADFQGAEAALVFGSGYLANVGTISCLVGREDAVLSDQLNHASMIDGCRLSGAAIFRYDHLDVDQLEAMLRLAERQGARRKLIVTESVFSMDGDVAPLAEIVELKERYGAALLVDEAHADGVYGPQGRGYAHELDLADRIDLHLGTFGKAYGVYGAYVAGSQNWIRYLVNASRSFVFTTALPPTVVDAIGAALTVAAAADDRRARLCANAARFRTRLHGLGLDTCGSSTQIVPLVVGDSRRTLALSQRLEREGILAVAIRPPTVPRGSARLRCSLTAAHDEEQLEHVLTAIEAAVAELDLIQDR